MKRAALVLIAALAGAAAQAQTTGTLVGQVRDASGGALPGAVVTVRHLDTGLTRSAATDATG
ncbi:MAG TPA: carboxypeptidase-like regulatory domain-containing protein, partial [Vicinamibacteria bacterium]